MPTMSLPVMAAGSSVSRLFMFMPISSWSGGVFACTAPPLTVSRSARIHAPRGVPVFMIYLPGRVRGLLFFSARRSVSADGMGFYVLKIDVLSEAGAIRKMYKTLLIHRVNDAVEISGRFVVFKEGVQQAAFVPATVADCADHRQTCRAVAVNFAVHAKRFRQTGDFHARRDPADAVCASA